MVGDSLEVTPTGQTTPASLSDVLLIAPRLYELLPGSSRQLLSATCSHLHKWIRENVSCIDIRQASELAHLAPKDWPNLAGVLLHKEADPSMYFDAKRLSNRKWHLDAQICFDHFDSHHFDVNWCDVMLLISHSDSHPQAEFDLTPRQCKVLSQCADRLRETTCIVTLVPQQQGSPTLCYLPNQLGSCLGCQPWPELTELHIYDQQCSLACAEGLVECSFPAMNSLFCSGLSTAGFHTLAQASWPQLTNLDLEDSNFDPSAVTLLSTSSWCGHLETLSLQGTVLGQEGVRALGMGQWDNLHHVDLRQCKIGSYDAVRCLAQVHFPSLYELCLTGNQFEAGAIRCLSAAQWPSLKNVSLGCHDVNDQDWGAFGIRTKRFGEPCASGKRDIQLVSPDDNAILPSIIFNIS